MQGSWPTLGHHGGRDIGSLFRCDRPGIVPPRCTSVANDLRHSVFLDGSLPEGLAESLRDTMAEDYTATTEFDMQPMTELVRSTDAIAYAHDYGDNGAAAWVYCPPEAPQGVNSEGDRWCRMQEIHFNLNPRYALFFADDGSRDHVACHELGHTIGLRHWGNPPTSVGPAAATCMNADTPDGPTALHQIDLDHIDAYHYAALRPSRRFMLAGTSFNATQVERYSTLAEMTNAADAVVRGSVVSVQPGRAFGDPASPFTYAAATIRIVDVLAGALSADDRTELTIELPLFGGPDSIGPVSATLSGAEGVFFLRDKAASARGAGMSSAQQRAEAGYYRLVTFGAMVWSEGGVAGVPADTSSGLASFGGRPFGEVAARISVAAD